MRRLIPRVLAIAALALCACGGVSVPAATDADARRASIRFPGITTDELNLGRRLYLSKCTACHLPVAPASIAPGEWPAHVREMSRRSGLDDGDATLIERYLVTIAAASHPSDGAAAN